MNAQAKINIYKMVLVLALPMALQNIIASSVELTGNIMVGSLGEFAISGVYVTNQIQSIIQTLILGLGAALTVLAVQYWSKKNNDSVKIIIGIALKIGVSLGIFPFMVTLLFPNQILRVFTSDQRVVNESLKYMNIIRFSYVFFCVTQILISSMRCVEKVRIALFISIVIFL